MGKTRVHLLAKELGVEAKDVIAQLDKLGMRGRKAQSSLEDDEAARVRAALAAVEKPQVHVGEEKVVADRVVTAAGESLGEIQARETIVERRVRANVIRRRTSRIEVPQPEALAPMEVKPSVEEQAPGLIETAPVETPVEDFPAEFFPEVETPAPDRSDFFELESEPAQQSPAEAEPFEAPVAEAAPVLEPEPAAPQSPALAQPQPDKPVAVQAPRSIVLGRIDLKQTREFQRAPPAPGARRPGVAAPGTTAPLRARLPMAPRRLPTAKRLNR